MKTFSIVWGKLCVRLLAACAFLAACTVSVYAQTIIVSQLSDLDFGTIPAGSSSTVNPNDPSAALFEISITNESQSSNNKEVKGNTNNSKNNGNGNGNAYAYGDSKTNVEVTFSLPGNLMQSGSNIPVSFPSESALWNDKNTTSGAKSFDPKQQTTLQIKKNKDLYIYLGGNIQTYRSQRPGSYSAVVSLTVTEMDD